MNSTSKNILIGFLIIAIIILFIYINRLKKSDKDMVSYRLPQEVDPEVFGPKYWFALHDIMSRIPCSLCRGDAEKMMIFMHDVVNTKLNRPLFDEANFNAWGELIMNIRLNGNKYPKPIV